MYLSEESVNQLFDLFHACSAAGCQILFDYVYSSVLREENRYYGERDIVHTIKKSGEMWTFGIEEGGVEQFLKSRNFGLVEELNSASIEDRYFKNREGEVVARVNNTHSIVFARKGN